LHALRGVNLGLYAGELVVLLGPSGSGKSTLLNIMGGLDTATGGIVSYRGKELTKATEKELTEYRRFHVGFVFQFYNLISSLTARENVSVVTEIAPDPMAPEKALELVGLSGRMNHFPAQLSGGEQQRVAIARAISKKDRRFFYVMNRPERLIPKQALSYSRRWSALIANWARPQPSLPITWISPAWPIVSFI